MAITTDWADRLSELDQWQTHIINQLVIERKLHREMGYWGDYHYTGTPDFLLQHGEWYSPTKWTGRYSQGAPKSCFGNAFYYAQELGLRYVEGVAWQYTLPLNFHHGWNTNAEHELIDTTWSNAGAAYLGVEFGLEDALAAIWFDNGTVLDNHKNRFALYKKPFTSVNSFGTR